MNKVVLNILLEDTIAIGDQNNDIPMFKAAGFSIAMGNAKELYIWIFPKKYIFLR